MPVPITCTIEVLPDSRMSTRVGAKFERGMWIIPFFCPNCGVLGGTCPEENMTFMFWLCPKCFETYGRIAGLMAMPDEVFFQKVYEEMIERWGRTLSYDELVKALQEGSTPLAALFRDRAFELRQAA